MSSKGCDTGKISQGTPYVPVVQRGYFQATESVKNVLLSNNNNNYKKKKGLELNKDFIFRNN